MLNPAMWCLKLLKLSRKVNRVDDVIRGYWASAFFNGDFYSIETYSGFRGGTHGDYKGVEHRLPPDACDQELGLAVLDAMSHSRWVLGIPREGSIYPSGVEFDKDLYDRELNMERGKKWIADLMVQYGYKTKRALFKNMRSCSIDRYGDSIKITPMHHEKLEAWGREKDDGIENVVIPADSSPLEIGAALRLAFSRCTG